MSTLDELLYYCKEENSFGALMLTGRWGCGKTYLIEHGLSEQLGDLYIVLRLSLFGVSSIEEINSKVKKAYFDSMMLNVESYFEPEHTDSNGKGKSWLPHLLGKATEKATSVTTNNKGVKWFTFIRDLAQFIPGAEKVLSINPSDYITVENKIGKKIVILVFDDLERNSLDEIDVLGCINEYCENNQFKTIIVANEEKIQKSKIETNGEGEYEKQKESASGTKITYKEIKEKIVTRTIKCMPNYEMIISEILSRFKDDDGRYKRFLLDHTVDIVNVFMAGESENIRSLKCAIQDFQRVYSLLTNSDLDKDLDKYLLAFIAFVLCFKEGKIQKSEDYGYIFSDSEVEKMYPLYYRNGYILYSAKAWVVEGEWKESEVKDEISRKVKSKRKPEPEKIVRGCPLILLDESIIEAGFPKVIKEAYAGKLTVDEYIILIENIAWARQISFELPVEIDMESIESGVKVCLNLIERSDEPDSKVRHMISDESKKLLTGKEKQIYDTISQFRDDNIQMFAINKRKYLSALSKSDMSDLYQCENKRFNLFDNEMASATAIYYNRLLNADRQTFINLFSKMWVIRCTSQDLQKTESIPGFELLRKELTILRDGERKIEHQLQAAISENFIQIVNEAIEKLSS